VTGNGRPRGRLGILLLTVAAGSTLSLQSFLNGRLGNHLGSAELAATVNNAVGLSCITVVGLLTGVPKRVARALHGWSELRWWHLIAGLNGALFVTVAAYAAPRVGIALLTVAAVCGQAIGSLGVDHAGLSPAGKRPVTVFRLSGVLLAVLAVALGAAEAHGEIRLGVLALALAAGAGIAFQQAAMGHVTRATGEPLAAAGLNFFVGAVALIAVALITARGSAPSGWGAPPVEWLGGVVAAAAAVVMARTVRRLGVLQLMLGITAGQSVGALIIDLVSPTRGQAVTAGTFVNLSLIVAAVAVSGLRRRPALDRAPHAGGPA
jgi:transporter family-2 protein